MSTAKSERPRYTRKRDGRYVWIVALEVDPAWVQDGFDLDDDRAKRMLEKELSYAYGHELAARVLRTPDPAAIRKEQGSDAPEQTAGILPQLEGRSP